jgi:asparagine synthase (glutamine-hydrolysing)
LEATSEIDGRDAALARMVDWFDEPYADTSAVPTALVCRMARDHVTVALSGDGGDELFGGYRRYGKFCRQRARDVFPRAVQRGLAPTLGPFFRFGSTGRRALQRWAMEDVARYAFLHGGMTRAEKRDAIPATVVSRFRAYDDYWAFRAHWHADVDPWSRMQYVDLKTYLPDDLLTKVDRVSMQVSLEVRPPFLDHHFVEFAASIPFSQRVRGSAMKYLLKRALRGVLGPESLDRGKQGFSMPLEGTELFRGSPETAAWRTPHRVAWSLLTQWTRSRLGVGSPLEILREGP